MYTVEDSLVSFIIPVWQEIPKPEDGLSDLLDSIQNTVKGRYEVIVVCNSQKSLIIEKVRTHPVVTRYCLNSTNVGVSRAWNMGVQMAEGNSLCFVNEDVVLGEGTIDNLNNILLTIPNIGMIGVEGANLEIVAGKIKQHQRFNDGLPRICDAISGYLFMVNTEVYKIVGGFDNHLTPCSYEEIDFAFRVRAKGYINYVVPGLKYRHPWGVSRVKPNFLIEYLNHKENIREINKRNLQVIVEHWNNGDYAIPSSTGKEYNGKYYDRGYFDGYTELMTQSRMVDGKHEQPLAVTLADMIDIVVDNLKYSIKTILDIGCAYGFVVQELVKRGYEAYGIDFSEECINNSPVKDRLILGDIRDVSLDKQYDMVIATNLFEHLSLPDVIRVIWNVSTISGAFFTVINKSEHDQSHINLRPNWKWILLFKKNGFFFDSKLTRIARNTYLRKSVGTERWHRDCLIFISQRKPDIIWWSNFIIEYLHDMFDLAVYKAVEMEDMLIKYLARVRGYFKG